MRSDALAQLLRRQVPLLLLLSLFPGISGAIGAPVPSPKPGQSGSDAGFRDFARGSFMAARGDYWGAIETFRTIAPPAPAEAAAVEYAISRAFVALSVADSARVHGDAAVRLDPGNSHYARHLARLSHDTGDYARAAELYGKAAALAPDRSGILYAQALEYVAAGTPTEALEVFSRLLAQNPLDEKALSQVLWLQIALKRYPEAIDTVGRLAAVAGRSQKLSLTLGQLYDLNGRGDLAIEAFRGIIAEERDAVPAWVALFDQRIRMGNRDELLREFREFEAVAPGGATSSIEVARIFASRAEKDSLFAAPAAMMLDELASRHGGDAGVHLLRGAFEMSQRRAGAAEASFARAVAIAPGEVSAWENLVMALLELKQRAKVFRTIDRAKRALPGQRLRVTVLEGYSLLHTGSPAKAASVLETVALRRKGSMDDALLVQANTSLAMACDQLGRRRQSARAYARVLELDAHNALAMNNLAFLYAEQGIMLQQALRYALNAVLLEPDNGVFLDTLGWVHYRLGSYDDARDMLEKAVATGIGEEEIFMHLGKTYQKLGQADKAAEMFEKARSVKGK